MAEAELFPDRETGDWLAAADIRLTEKSTAERLLQRQGLRVDAFLDACETSSKLPDLVASFRALNPEELEAVVSGARYSGYVEKQLREVERFRSDEDLRIPADFSYRRPGLSREVVEKLEAVRPASLGQAGRVRGVTPAAISILRMHLKHNGGRLDGSARAAGSLQESPVELGQ
jgi:tRNA uridine 5-carboxymethylaminomethyl modification enzyme